MQGPNRTAWALTGPAILIVMFVLVYPVLQSVVLSVGSSNLQQPDSFEFAGLQNFKQMLTTPRFWSAVSNTLIFTGVTVPIELVIGMGLALALNRSYRGRGLVRLAVLFPWALPTALNALIWRWMYNSDFGIFNSVLLQSGLIRSPIDWLGKIPMAMLSMMIVAVWKTSSFMALILLSGLQTIPDELYEAGIVDGASGWSGFRRITLPLLRPTIMVALLLRSMDAIRAFELPFNLTDGGPVNSTETLSLYAYKLLFQHVDFNMGAASVLLQFVVILSLSLVYVRSMKGDTA